MQDAAANLLSVLNRTYFTPRVMLGSLEGLNTGALSYFVAVDGRFETWELTVHLPDEGFYATPRLFVVQATLLLDTERGLITHTTLANNRFRLRLSTR